MSDKIFLDTNLWVYFFSKNPLEKSEKVQKIIESHPENLLISTQVLGELYNVLTRKKLASKPEVEAIVLKLITSFIILDIDTAKVIQALEISSLYGYTYWDSLILATALLSNCTILYSEDMQHNQLIKNKVRIVNPFISTGYSC
jgi:predicted nucleic acid-binding protein